MHAAVFLKCMMSRTDMAIAQVRYNSLRGGYPPAVWCEITFTIATALHKSLGAQSPSVYVQTPIPTSLSNAHWLGCYIIHVSMIISLV